MIIILFCSNIYIGFYLTPTLFLILAFFSLSLFFVVKHFSSNTTYSQQLSLPFSSSSISNATTTVCVAFNSTTNNSPTPPPNAVSPSLSKNGFRKTSPARLRGCGFRSDKHRTSIRVDIEMGSHLLHGVWLFQNKMGLHISEYLVVLIKRSILISDDGFLVVVVVVVDGWRCIPLRYVGVEVVRSETMEDGWRFSEFRL
ncbi:hypothetical protein L6452_15914 [Arctium lappa]|uniref:Uncharacterized protein n=1 Tax=Arctium lappa TaxID=4217 RepID=A0ACB9CQ45_ARCLA|nr:hypothetical protein L6452_15914 [Arctium lappa]